MCSHEEFKADVCVIRLDDGKFSADITIECASCGVPFQFLGVPPGVDLSGATVSIDGLELQAAIAPQGTHPSPMHRMMGVRLDS